jgi:polysaccharide export outer membrane protein
MLNLSKWVALSALLAPSLFAQAPESLLIGPGDLVHVQVFDTPELEQRARVTDSGYLQMIMGGSVKIADMTPAEAAKAVEGALITGNFMQHPSVLITVEQYVTQKVSIWGEVRLPGAYEISTSRSIVDVLSLAGGLTELADRRIVIERHGTSEKISYFISNSPGPASDPAVKVYPGDTVQVPRAGLVYALGDVIHPGGYTMTNNDGKLSVLELVARSGGISHASVPSHALLIRKSSNGYVQMPLPLDKLEKGKQPDFDLQADDIIYVPFSYLKNFAVNGSSIAAAAGSAAVYRF